MEQENHDTRRDYHRDYHRRRRENDGKPLTPPDTRTAEQKVADDAAKRERKRTYHREYQRKKAREKREAQAAESKTTGCV